MTLVNHDTGEPIDAIAADEARRLTTEAQNEFRSSREHFDRAWSLIEQAVEGAGHLALGYRSPGDYLHQEFDGVLSGLDVPSRRVAVKTMTEWGLSTRAIAQPLGVSNKTVNLDQRTPVTEVTPEPLPDFEDHVANFVSATDALAEIDQSPEGEQAATPFAGGSASEQGGRGAPTPVTPSRSESAPARPPAPIVGRDGKTYQRPTSAPKPDLTQPEAADYDNATKSSQALARAVSKLLQLQYPNMRAGMRDYWTKASIEVPPAQRADVTPEQMRVAAHGLLALADEWTQP